MSTIIVSEDIKNKTKDIKSRFKHNLVITNTTKAMDITEFILPSSIALDCKQESRQGRLRTDSLSFDIKIHRHSEITFNSILEEGDTITIKDTFEGEEFPLFVGEVEDVPKTHNNLKHISNIQVYDRLYAGLKGKFTKDEVIIHKFMCRNDQPQNSLAHILAQKMGFTQEEMDFQDVTDPNGNHLLVNYAFFEEGDKILTEFNDLVDAVNGRLSVDSQGDLVFRNPLGGQDVVDINYTIEDVIGEVSEEKIKAEYKGIKVEYDSFYFEDKDVIWMYINQDEYDPKEDVAHIQVNPNEEPVWIRFDYVTPICINIEEQPEYLFEDAEGNPVTTTDLGFDLEIDNTGGRVKFHNNTEEVLFIEKFKIKGQPLVKSSGNQVEYPTVEDEDDYYDISGNKFIQNEQVAALSAGFNYHRHCNSRIKRSFKTPMVPFMQIGQKVGLTLLDANEDVVIKGFNHSYSGDKESLTDWETETYLPFSFDNSLLNTIKADETDQEVLKRMQEMERNTVRKYNYPPEYPMNLSVIARPLELILSWDEVDREDIRGYRVHYASPEGQGQLFVNANEYKFSADSEVEYTFKVKALTFGDMESDYSYEVIGTPLIPTDLEGLLDDTILQIDILEGSMDDSILKTDNLEGLIGDSILNTNIEEFEFGDTLIDELDGEIDDYIQPVEPVGSFIRRSNSIMHNRIDDNEGSISDVRQTADEISLQVWNKEGQSLIRINAEDISQVVGDVSGNQSLIKQNADSIDSVVEQNSLTDSIATTSQSIEGEVSSIPINNLEISLDAQETIFIVDKGSTNYYNLIVLEDVEVGSLEIPIQSTVVNVSSGSGVHLRASSNRSIIRQTSDEIRSEVGQVETNLDMEDAVNSPYTSISQTANKIEQRVEGIDGNTSWRLQDKDSIMDTVSTVDSEFDEDNPTSAISQIQQQSDSITNIVEQNSLTGRLTTITEEYTDEEVSTVSVEALPITLSRGDYLFAINRDSGVVTDLELLQRAVKGSTFIAIETINLNLPKGSGLHLKVESNRSLINQTSDEITQAIFQTSYDEGDYDFADTPLEDISHKSIDELIKPITPLGSVIRQNIGEIQSTVTNVAGHQSQITQLANEYTVKLTRNGRAIGGFGLSSNDSDFLGDYSEFAVVADRFKLYATEEAEEAKPMFTVDTITNQVYLVGDLIAEGVIKAHMIDTEELKSKIANIEEAFITSAQIDSIQAEKVLINDNIEMGSDGVWGYKLETDGSKTKQAGFGTDGRLLGGGKDENNDWRFKVDAEKIVVNTKQLKIDEEGNANFSGELAANTVSYDNLEVNFAEVEPLFKQGLPYRGVTGWDNSLAGTNYGVDGETIYTAENYKEWNIFRLPVEADSYHQFRVHHKSLSTLNSNYQIRWGYIREDNENNANEQKTSDTLRLVIDDWVYRMADSSNLHYQQDLNMRVTVPDGTDRVIHLGHIMLSYNVAYFRLYCYSLPPAEDGFDGHIYIAFRRNSLE